MSDHFQVPPENYGQVSLSLISRHENYFPSRPFSEGFLSEHIQVPAENEVLQFVSHLLLQGDVEEGIDEAVEVGRDHHVIQQSPSGRLLLFCFQKSPADEDNCVGPPAQEKCWGNIINIMLQNIFIFFFKIFFTFWPDMA